MNEQDLKKMLDKINILHKIIDSPDSTLNNIVEERNGFFVHSTNSRQYGYTEEQIINIKNELKHIRQVLIKLIHIQDQTTASNTKTLPEDYNNKFNIVGTLPTIGEKVYVKINKNAISLETDKKHATKFNTYNINECFNAVLDIFGDTVPLYITRVS